MQLFIGRLIFYIDRPQHYQTLFDEQVRMICASTPAEAQQKFEMIGKQEEIHFINTNNDEVNWKYICTREIFDLNEKRDGSVLFSNTIECEDAASYIRFVQQNIFPLQTETFEQSEKYVSA